METGKNLINEFPSVMDNVSEIKQALVLAAGKGNRLRECAKQKAIHYIAGVPLLGRILQGLKEAGIESVHIVIGYEGDDIRREIGKNYLGLDVSYVIAQNWEKGNLHSFMTAKWTFKEEFILCMADHIFDNQIVKGLINVDHNSSLVLAIDRVGYAFDDTKVLEHEGMILDIGKDINPSNCVDTGFFFCSPKIFSYAEMAVNQGKSELADCIRIAAQNGDAQVLDVSGHYWVDVDNKKDIERAKRVLAKYSQKKRGASDFVAHYINRPIENAITYRLSDSRVTPNQITILANVLAYLVTALFLFGHLFIGSVLTFVVGLIDGLDGKLARIRGHTTKLGRMEHLFDLLFEFSWLIALAMFLSQSKGSLPLLLVAFSITFISFYRFCYDQFSRTTGISLDVYGRFERAFRRIAGRRNIYNVYILIGVLLGTPLYSLIGILFHSALTAVVYASRAAIHMHAIDKKEQTNRL
jgi:CDP-L-myo-inositol myo-inositolphosphotransferase